MGRGLVGLLALLALAPLAASGHEGAPWWVAGSDAYFWSTSDPAKRAEMMAALRGAHMNTFYADAKDERGWVGWSSPHPWPTPFAFPPGDGPVERAVASAHGALPKLAVAARYSTFQDEAQALGPLAGARIGATRWLDPACPGVVEHVQAQVLDLLQRTQVDEVNLDFVRYPAWGDVGVNVPLPCTGGKLLDEDPSRFAHVASAVQRVAGAVKAAHPSVSVSADVFGYTCYAPMVDIGQDAAMLAPHVDWLMPMLYPAYFAPPGSFDPYGTVRAATAACVGLVGDADKVKPWVQGFHHLAYAYGNTASVAAQVKGVRDGGGSGAVVWWFETMGTHPLVWQPLAKQMPPDWTHRPFR